MSLRLLLLLLTPLSSLAGAAPRSAGDPKEFEVRPTPLAWEQLSSEVFDRRWILPDPRTAPGADFLREMRDLLALRFDLELPDGTRYRCLGDLAARARELPPERHADWFAALERSAPELMAERGEVLSQLLFDEELHGARWEPSRDGARDGMWFADAWKLKAEGAPWSDLRVSALMEQAATLIHADLAAIKAVENDYRAYPDNVGADYEEIFPIEGSYFVGPGEGGRPFSALTIQFRCDLPFPFSGYTMRLAILNRFTPEGVLCTDIYSTSEDFYWLAGRDVFLPVSTSRGEWVAFLLVRHFGFDLRGVPDGSGDRREALRASLGNLKRNAERRHAGRERGAPEPRNDPAFLEKVPVLGRK